MIPYRVETPRLILRCLHPADAPLMQAAKAGSKEHLLPWMPWAQTIPDALDADIALLRGWRAAFDSDRDYAYGIFPRDEGELWGCAGMHQRIGPSAREIGYWVRVEQINRGVATETAAALARVGFDYLGLNRIEIHCDERNIRSAAVPAKLSFTLEATRRRLSIAADRAAGSMIWTLFADEYPRSPVARVEIEAFDAIGRKIAPEQQP